MAKDVTKKKSKKKLWIVLGIIAVIVIIAMLLVINARNAASAIGEVGVEAVPLEMHDLSDSINVTGKVESQNVWVATTDITSAKVKDLNVSLGDRVSEGDILCSFDEEELTEQITSLEEQISETDAQTARSNSTAITDAEMSLTQAEQSEKDQIAAAEAEYESAKKAYHDGKEKKKNGLSESERLQLESNLQSAEEAVDTAQASLVTAQLSYQEAQGTGLPQSQMISLAQAVRDAQKSVDSAQRNLEIAQATYDETMEKGAITDTELESLKNAYETAKRNLKSTRQTTANTVTSAENSLANAKANATSTTSSSESDLAKMKRQLNQMTITAGQSGVVTQLNISKGSIATGTLIKVEDDTALKVNVTISEKDIVKIKEGMEATITSNALPDQEIKGKVTQVINFASAGTSSLTDGSDSSSGSSYSAMIEIAPGSDLLLGMSVKVSIAIGSEGTALSVPYDSIYYDDNGDMAVMRAIDNGDGNYAIEKVAVTIGEQNDYYAEIKGDVKEGDLIVLNPYIVTDGGTTELTVIDGSTKMENLGSSDSSDSDSADGGSVVID